MNNRETVLETKLQNLLLSSSKATSIRILLLQAFHYQHKYSPLKGSMPGVRRLDHHQVLTNLNDRGSNSETVGLSVIENAPKVHHPKVSTRLLLRSRLPHNPSLDLP